MAGDSALEKAVDVGKAAEAAKAKPNQKPEVPRGSGTTLDKLSPTGSAKQELGMTTEAAPKPNRRDIEPKTKGEILQFLKARTADSQAIARTGDRLGVLEIVLLREEEAAQKGQESIFSRIDKGDFSADDAALIWSSLALTETALRAARGRHGAVMESAHSKERGIAEKPGGLFGRDPKEIRQVTSLKRKLERTFYPHGRLSPDYWRQRKGSAPDQYDTQTGHEFTNAIAGRIDVWEKTHPGKDWDRFVQEEPASANAVLKEAMDEALLLTSDNALRRILEHQDTKSTVSAIDAQIAAKQGTPGEKSIGGSQKTDSATLKREVTTAERTAEDSQAALSRANERRQDLEGKILQRRKWQTELDNIPAQIKILNERAQQTEEQIKDEESLFQGLPSGRDGESMKHDILKSRDNLREMANSYRKHAVELEVERAPQLRTELASDGTPDEAKAREEELERLKTQIDGDQQSGAEGLSKKVQRAESDLRDKKRALEDAEALTSNQQTQTPETGGENTNKTLVDRLQMWRNVATNFDKIPATVMADRTLGQFNGYSRDHLASTTAVGADSVQGLEVIRRLIFQETATEAGNPAQFNAEAARVALNTETIIRAMMEVDGEVGNSKIELPDKTTTTVKGMINQVAALRKANPTEKADIEKLNQYEVLLAKAALPAIQIHEWTPPRVNRFATLIAHEGIQQAALGESVLSLEGLPERQADLQIQSAESLITAEAGEATVIRNGDEIVVKWKGETAMPLKRGEGFKSEAEKDNTNPKVEVVDMEARINGERTRMGFGIKANQALLEMLPAELKTIADLKNVFPGPNVSEAELRTIRDRFYRKRPGTEKEASEQQKKGLAKYPKTSAITRALVRQATQMEPSISTKGLGSTVTLETAFRNQDEIQDEMQNLIEILDIKQANVDSVARKKANEDSLQFDNLGRSKRNEYIAKAIDNAVKDKLTERIIEEEAAKRETPDMQEDAKKALRTQEKGNFNKLDITEQQKRIQEMRAEVLKTLSQIVSEDTTEYVLRAQGKGRDRWRGKRWISRFVPNVRFVTQTDRDINDWISNPDIVNVQEGIIERRAINTLAKALAEEVVNGHNPRQRQQILQGFSGVNITDKNLRINVDNNGELVVSEDGGNPQTLESYYATILGKADATNVQAVAEAREQISTIQQQLGQQILRSFTVR